MLCSGDADQLTNITLDFASTATMASFCANVSKSQEAYSCKPLLKNVGMIGLTGRFPSHGVTSTSAACRISVMLLHTQHS